MPTLPSKGTGGSVYTGVATPTLSEYEAMHKGDQLAPINEERVLALSAHQKGIDYAGSTAIGSGEGDADEEDKAWQDFANCLGVDPDLFFPERGASTNEAKEVCKGCAVREACLEYALANVEKFGIWGGLSERERRRIRRQRNLARRTTLEAEAEQ